MISKTSTMVRTHVNFSRILSHLFLFLFLSRSLLTAFRRTWYFLLCNHGLRSELGL
ncbi:hypothetical protein Hanom_Chr07g00597281 [Helianthus anomalus]